MITSIKTRKKTLHISEAEISQYEVLEIISKSLEEIHFEGQSNLKSIRLYCPKLKSISKELFHSSKLCEIKIKDNQHFEKIQDHLSNLENLNVIQLINLNIHSFPEFIKGSLLTLELLDISKNKIELLPNYLANASEIKRLILDNNPISKFHFNREDFEHLKYLSLDGLSFSEEDLLEIKKEFSLI